MGNVKGTLPGGNQIIFWWGWVARGLKPLPISKDFSSSRNSWFGICVCGGWDVCGGECGGVCLLVFFFFFFAWFFLFLFLFLIFTNRDPFLRVFYLRNGWFYILFLTFFFYYYYFILFYFILSYFILFYIYIYFFFAILVKWYHLLWTFFWPKWDPCLGFLMKKKPIWAAHPRMPQHVSTPLVPYPCRQVELNTHLYVLLVFFQ